MSKKIDRLGRPLTDAQARVVSALKQGCRIDANFRGDWVMRHSATHFEAPPIELFEVHGHTIESLKRRGLLNDSLQYLDATDWLCRERLRMVVEEHGYEDPASFFADIDEDAESVAGVCMICGNDIEVPRNETRGYCPKCDNQEVHSVLTLAKYL